MACEAAWARKIGQRSPSGRACASFFTIQCKNWEPWEQDPLNGVATGYTFTSCCMLLQCFHENDTQNTVIYVSLELSKAYLFGMRAIVRILPVSNLKRQDSARINVLCQRSHLDHKPC
jgi:hypothetical protein